MKYTIKQQDTQLITSRKKTQFRAMIEPPSHGNFGRAAYGFDCLLSLENGTAIFNLSVTDGYQNHFVKSPVCVGYNSILLSDICPGADDLVLRIDNIRIERVQEISESDAVEEGFVSDWDNSGFSAVNTFADSFDAIYGDGTFDNNPFVWVYDFTYLGKIN